MSVWKKLPGFPETFTFCGCNLWSKPVSCSHSIHDLIVQAFDFDHVKRYDVYAHCYAHITKDKYLHILNDIIYKSGKHNVTTMTLQEFEIFAVHKS